MRPPADSFDQRRAELFGQRMEDLFNQIGLALMLEIGHGTGLLERLAGLPPSTIAQIAQAAGLNERYVREWLFCLAAADVVDYQPETATFHLPTEHGVWLSSAGPQPNLAAEMEFLESFQRVAPLVMACFRKGGGVSYSQHSHFHQVMARSRGAFFETALLGHLLPLLPGAAQALDAGARLADFGCGNGRVLTLLAQRFPRSSFFGYDISPEYIAQARDAASRLGLGNVLFHLADFTQADVRKVFDYALAFDSIHDLARPAEGLQAIARALKPEGRLLMQEFAASSRLEENLDHPVGPWLYAQSVMYCMTVSLAQGGAGLGCMWGRERALEMLAETGFGEVQVKRTEGDPYSDYFVARVG